MATSQAKIMSEFTNPDVEVLISAEQIKEKIRELGANIARDYAGRNPLLIGVLKGRGYSAFLLTPAEARSGDKLFRVEVGPFGSRAEAEKARRKLADEGFKPFLRY